MLVIGLLMLATIAGFTGLVMLTDYRTSTWSGLGWIALLLGGGAMLVSCAGVWWWLGRRSLTEASPVPAHVNAHQVYERRSPWPMRLLVGGLLALTWGSWAKANEAFALAEAAEDEADAVRQELSSVRSDVESLWQRVP
jgi:hypothetical protein